MSELDRQPPRLAMFLTALAAGPMLRDVVLGDLHEQFVAHQHSRGWFWWQALRSIGWLTWLQCCEAGRWRCAQIGLTASLSLALLWLWELRVAQTWSWPMAKTLLAWSPLSATATCQTCYAILYVMPLAFVAAMTALGGRLRSVRRLRLPLALLGMVALVPVVFYWFSPGPYDGNKLFRLWQAALVVMAVFSVVLMRSPSPRHRLVDA
ncbi:MAG: hypothetical protein AAF290_01285 [Pseudomonadota bacterium]